MPQVSEVVLPDVFADTYFTYPYPAYSCKFQVQVRVRYSNAFEVKNREGGVCD